MLPKRLTEIPWPKNIIAFNARRSLPYTDKSAKFIYMSHLLKHLLKSDAMYLIKEHYSIFVFNGVLRTIVSNLLISVKNYTKDFYK